MAKDNFDIFSNIFTFSQTCVMIIISLIICVVIIVYSVSIVRDTLTKKLREREIEREREKESARMSKRTDGRLDERTDVSVDGRTKFRVTMCHFDLISEQDQIERESKNGFLIKLLFCSTYSR